MFIEKEMMSGDLMGLELGKNGVEMKELEIIYRLERDMEIYLSDF